MRDAISFIMSVWLSVHDYPSAKVAVEAEIDVLLIGDSLGMTVYGMENTKEVTMDMMLRHTEAVIKAAPKDFPIVADMPFGTYNTAKFALDNAKKFKKIGTKKIKLEGGGEISEVIKVLVKNGFEVTGHLGLLPQTAEKFCVAGKNEEEAKKIKNDALLLEKLGVKNIVLECVPAALAQEITEMISVPTIGIGAGKNTSGQILVFNDVVGRSENDFSPKFLRRFGDIFTAEKNAVKKYTEAVREKKFPNDSESY